VYIIIKTKQQRKFKWLANKTNVTGFNQFSVSLSFVLYLSLGDFKDEQKQGAIRWISTQQSKNKYTVSDTQIISDFFIKDKKVYALAIYVNTGSVEDLRRLPKRRVTTPLQDIKMPMTIFRIVQWIRN